MRTLAGGTSSGARRDDDDGLATEGQDSGSEHRRCRGRSGSPRGGEQRHEAEESPSDKGAMRARGEVPLELQGMQRLSARSSAPMSARSAVGHQSASMVVYAVSARSAVGQHSASTVVERSKCKECGGGSICEHGRQRSTARSAVGHQSASTVVGALTARSAVGHQSASTVVSALSARSAVGHQSASTVVSAHDARSAVGHQSASTVVSAIDVRSAVGASICEHGRERHRVQGVSWCINS